LKGDGDEAVSVSDYVAQLRTDLMQQAAHERKRWLFFHLKNLVAKQRKNWKPSLVDIARFQQLPVAHQEGGQLKKDEIMPVIMDELMGAVQRRRVRRLVL